MVLLSTSKFPEQWDAVGRSASINDILSILSLHFTARNANVDSQSHVDASCKMPTYLSHNLKNITHSYIWMAYVRGNFTFHAFHLFMNRRLTGTQKHFLHCRLCGSILHLLLGPTAFLHWDLISILQSCLVLTEIVSFQLHLHVPWPWPYQLV